MGQIHNHIEAINQFKALFASALSLKEKSDANEPLNVIQSEFKVLAKDVKSLSKLIPDEVMGTGKFLKHIGFIEMYLNKKNDKLSCKPDIYNICTEDIFQVQVEYMSFMLGESNNSRMNKYKRLQIVLENIRHNEPEVFELFNKIGSSLEFKDRDGFRSYLLDYDNKYWRIVAGDKTTGGIIKRIPAGMEFLEDEWIKQILPIVPLNNFERAIDIFKKAGIPEAEKVCEDIVIEMERKGEIEERHNEHGSPEYRIKRKMAKEGESFAHQKAYDELSAKIDKVLEGIKRNEMGSEIIYDEIEGLKEYITVLDKKTWTQLLKGKLVDLAASKAVGLSFEMAAHIYTDITGQSLDKLLT